MNNDKQILKLKNLSAGYGKKLILKNIDLRFCEGDFIAIVGPNGCGKTSLINAVFGVCEIVNGEILGDKNVCSAVPQISKPIFNFTVRDFIDLGFVNCVGKVDYEKIIEKLDLRDLLKLGVKEISAGQYQRALIAQSLMKNPQLLFLDEPLSHLDLKYQFKILDFLKELAKSGVCIVAVIHHLEFAIKKEYFDKLIFMKNGKICDQIDTLDDQKIQNKVEDVFDVTYSCKSLF